jgi:hypothetical protein
MLSPVESRNDPAESPCGARCPLMSEVPYHQIAPKRVGRSLVSVLCVVFSVSTGATENVRAHGLWVWKGLSIAQSARNVRTLREFCESQGINEVYLSVSDHGDTLGLDRFADLIEQFHRSNIRIEALLSSENGDEPGEHRDKLLRRVQDIVQFNQRHPNVRFDGIHLDIEPQQRRENKGSGNLRFLPDLVDTYRAVRAMAGTDRLTVNADIQNKLLKGDAEERRMLLASLPRLTLMLYEVSSPNDGDSMEGQMEKLRVACGSYLRRAYEGLSDVNLATMIIALRTSDYGERLPKMLKTLDEINGTDPHYQGWARHSFNDILPGAH